MIVIHCPFSSLRTMTIIHLDLSDLTWFSKNSRRAKVWLTISFFPSVLTCEFKDLFWLLICSANFVPLVNKCLEGPTEHHIVLGALQNITERCLSGCLSLGFKVRRCQHKNAKTSFLLKGSHHARRIQFSLGPSYWMGRVYKWKWSMYVCVYVCM